MQLIEGHTNTEPSNTSNRPASQGKPDSNNGLLDAAISAANNFLNAVGGINVGSDTPYDTLLLERDALLLEKEDWLREKNSLQNRIMGLERRLTDCQGGDLADRATAEQLAGEDYGAQQSNTISSHFNPN